MGEPLFVIAIGFLAGMIPAMLLAGFLSGRQVEKQRKDLQLKYERQVLALRATLRRLMQRIEVLTGERNQLRRANKSLRDVVREQQQTVDDSGTELDRNRAELSELQQQVDELARENLRYEGRLEEARIHQDRMSAQFKETVGQLVEVNRLRRNLLFATSQLRNNQINTKSRKFNPELQPTNISNSTPGELDISAIHEIEPLYVERLHESGIHTVADLADQTPARIAHFAGLESEEESGKWITAARALIDAAPRPLV